MAEPTADRFGLLYRPEFAAGLCAFPQSVDSLEIISEDFMRKKDRDGRAAQDKLCLLRDFAPRLHGVSAGLASAAPVNEERLAALARAVEFARPAVWSEHLAFVRGGSYEIGHLALPPFTAEVVEGTLRNLARARQVVGSLPLLENIAALYRPPLAEYTATQWTTAILRESGAGLLLDLHNLYADAWNAGSDPLALLEEYPLDTVEEIHLSGGKIIQGEYAGRAREYLLDDHLHDPPPDVYALLERAAALCPRPLTVIIERDGDCPDFAIMRAQLDLARAAVARGRALARSAAGSAISA